MEETNRLHDKLTGPSEGGYGLLYHGAASPQTVAERMVFYEDIMETLRSLLATGCYWGNAAQHGLWVVCLERLANLPDTSGNPDWLNLRRFPALLTLYAGGIAALAAEQYDTLAALLLRGRVRQLGQERRLVLAVNPSAVVGPELADRLPGKERHYTPVSDYLYERAVVWEPLRELIPMEERFAEYFDRFESLLGLVHVDENLQAGGTAWGPIGRFARRDRGVRFPRVLEALATEAMEAGSEWLPLRVGLFGGDQERFEVAMHAYGERIHRRGMW